jgi:hypothetical protein
MSPARQPHVPSGLHENTPVHAEKEKGKTMLFYCEFTWFPGTTREEVASRIVRQHDAGKNKPEQIKGWYNLVGGGAGFLIVDYNDPKELTAFLQPYMDVMSFDVRAITENAYEATVEEMRTLAGGS